MKTHHLLPSSYGGTLTVPNDIAPRLAAVLSSYLGCPVEAVTIPDLPKTAEYSGFSFDTGRNLRTHAVAARALIAGWRQGGIDNLDRFNSRSELQPHPRAFV